MLTVKPTQYIYPPRPADAIPRGDTEILGDMGWLAQLKYNDSRCLVKFLPDGTIELWNRHGERFRNYTTPDWLTQQLHQVREALGLAAGEYHLLDGGLLDAKHKAIKDTIVIWDILVRNGEHLLDTTYADRYATIAQGTTPWYYSHPTYDKPIQIGMAYGDGPEWWNVIHPQNFTADKWPGLWDLVAQINQPFEGTAGPLIEGLVFKDPQGRLGMGFKEKNNSEWLMRSRVKTGRHDF